MSSKKDGINPIVARSAYSSLLKYYRSRGMDRGAAGDKALQDLVNYGYIEDKAELKLGIAVTAQTGFFYNAMHYVVLPAFELSPAGIFKDAVSLPFGKDLVYGTKLKWWNYAMVGMPIAYKAFRIGKGLGLADEFLDLGDYFPKVTKGRFIEFSDKAQEYIEDLSHVTGKSAKIRNAFIDEVIKRDFPNLKLTYKPTYNPHIRTGVAKMNKGTQIGKKSFARDKLRDTIIHEELHHRWWKRGIFNHHPLNSPREKLFYEIIKRYKKMRKWE